MFIHNFKYALKTLFKNRMLIFWTFAFPIILGTFFKMAFSDIEKSEQLDIIDIAIVDNEEFKNNQVFSEAFKTLSDKKNKDRLFNIKYVDEDNAKTLLNDDEIDGYLVLKDTPKVVIMSNGINETILKYVTEEIYQSQDIIANIYKITDYTGENPERKINPMYAQINKEATELIEKNKTNIKNISSNNLSYTMVEFYTLIAMACLYSGILSMVAINQVLANMSNNGKRVAVSPTSKFTLVISSVLASFITQLIGLILLFLYTIIVLEVDYGNNLPLTLLLAFVGCFTGVSIGVAIASIFKTNENLKTGIMLAFTMFGCFLSGMMGITMKYLVDKNVPIINKLNPANMLTDGFYSLYYYDTLDRFYFNIISLLIFSSIMIALSIISLRRQKYDSI